ncbi:hypothetical protein QJQ45_011038, partial [Haematococcus lacustris]
EMECQAMERGTALSGPLAAYALPVRLADLPTSLSAHPPSASPDPSAPGHADATSRTGNTAGSSSSSSSGKSSRAGSNNTSSSLGLHVYTHAWQRETDMRAAAAAQDVPPPSSVMRLAQGPTQPAASPPLPPASLPPGPAPHVRSPPTPPPTRGRPHEVPASLLPLHNALPRTAVVAGQVQRELLAALAELNFDLTALRAQVLSQLDAAAASLAATIPPELLAQASSPAPDSDPTPSPPKTSSSSSSAADSQARRMAALRAALTGIAQRRQQAVEGLDALEAALLHPQQQQQQQQQQQGEEGSSGLPDSALPAASSGAGGVMGRRVFRSEVLEQERLVLAAAALLKDKLAGASSSSSGSSSGSSSSSSPTANGVEAGSEDASRGGVGSSAQGEVETLAWPVLLRALLSLQPGQRASLLQQHPRAAAALNITGVDLTALTTRPDYQGFSQPGQQQPGRGSRSPHTTPATARPGSSSPAPAEAATSAPQAGRPARGPGARAAAVAAGPDTTAAGGPMQLDSLLPLDVLGFSYITPAQYEALAAAARKLGPPGKERSVVAQERAGGRRRGETQAAAAAAGRRQAGGEAAGAAGAAGAGLLRSLAGLSSGLRSALAAVQKHEAREEREGQGARGRGESRASLLDTLRVMYEADPGLLDRVVRVEALAQQRRAGSAEAARAVQEELRSLAGQRPPGLGLAEAVEAEGGDPSDTTLRVGNRMAGAMGGGSSWPLTAAWLEAVPGGKVFHRGSGERQLVHLPTYPSFEVGAWASGDAGGQAGRQAGGSTAAAAREAQAEAELGRVESTAGGQLKLSAISGGHSTPCHLPDSGVGGYPLEALDQCNEGELSALNRRVATEQEAVLVDKFRAELLFNLGLRGEGVRDATSLRTAPNLESDWLHAPMVVYDITTYGKTVYPPKYVVNQRGAQRPLTEQESVWQERRVGGGNDPTLRVHYTMRRLKQKFELQ